MRRRREGGAQFKVLKKNGKKNKKNKIKLQSSVAIHWLSNSDSPFAQARVRTIQVPFVQFRRIRPRPQRCAASEGAQDDRTAPGGQEGEEGEVPPSGRGRFPSRSVG